MTHDAQLPTVAPIGAPIGAPRPEDQHDPGGASKWPLPDGMRGSARFSSCGFYRPMLERDWTPDGAASRTVLFVGKNPSTASALVQDPTCAKECAIARRLGYTRYLKGNVLDWRATEPKDLPKDPTLASSSKNIGALVDMALEAEIVVMVYGNLHARYSAAVHAALAALKGTGKDLFCFSINKDGSAKHPLYIRSDTVLVPFAPPPP